ncbi:hypothetical protein LTR17_020038 [Elasticomyces elasticus]|nr:hypothetical protein LTR17_020038 [Elasticomyces elasticus]
MAPTVSDPPVKFSLAAVSAQQKQGKAKRSAPNPLVEYNTAVPLTHTLARDEEDPADMYAPSPSEARRQRSISPSDPPFEARSRWCYSGSHIAPNPPVSHHTAVPLTHWMHKWARGVSPNARESTSSEPSARRLLASYGDCRDHDLTATTATRNLGGKPKRKRRKIRHEFKSHPRLPALTDVCKEIREEATVVFWLENIFRLRVGDAKSGYALSHYRKDATFRHVVLCFDIAYTIYGNNLIRSKQVAELEVKLKGDGTVAFTPGSWLGKECCCQLIREMEEYIHKKRKSLKHTGLLCLTLDFDPRLRWMYDRKTDRRADNWSEICDECGKKVWNDDTTAAARSRFGGGEMSPQWKDIGKVSEEGPPPKRFFD